MAGKVVDFDPGKRLSKEAFEEMMSMIATTQFEEVDSMCVIFKPKEGILQVSAYGLDFNAIGQAYSVLNVMSQQILGEAYNEPEE